MAAQNSNSENASASLSKRLSRMIAGGSLDYNSWRLLISEIEKASPEDINMLSLAYDSFLSKFPLCNWHLEKYAYKKAKLCSSQEVVNIYERVGEVAMFSVGFWVDYFTFAAACFGDPEDVRRLFGRAISFVGKDYFCHVLWDKYMKYEFNQEGWSFLAQSYIQVLRFPTKKLHFYYDNFKQFIANLEEEMGYDKNNGMGVHASVPSTAIDLSKDEISHVVKDMLDSSERSFKSKALDKYRSIGEGFYQEACKIDEKVKCYEAKIQRRYFDATPLDNDQLNNWHLYLDFIEKEDNMDWAMKLYERCLIPCATYPEFWMRYVEFLESNGGRELAVLALARATQIFLKNVLEIHLFDARFKEHIGDADGARAALVVCDTKTDSSFIENVAIQTNLERRLGNFAAASATYEKALKESRESKKLHLIPSLYSHFAHLTFLMTGSASAARDVLIKGIREVPHCRVLLEELVKFAMTHEGATHVNIIDSIITDAISPGLDEYEGLNAKDRANISRLFLEFVDFCGTKHDIRKAWNRHVKLFPQSLRSRAPYMHSTRGNYLMDLAQDKKGLFVHSEPSKDSSFGHPLQLLEFPVNNELHPHQVAGKLSPQKNHTTDAKEMMLAPLTKGVVSSNDDESHGNEMGCETSCQSKEHINISAEIGVQSKDNALSPHEVGKSAETTEPIEVSHFSLISVQPELDNELKQQGHPVYSGYDSLNSWEKKCQEIHFVESPQVGTELKRDVSVSRPEPSRTDVDSIGIDRGVPPPKSGPKEHTHDQSNGQQNSDKATEYDYPTTPTNSMSVGQQPVSSHPVSYPQQNTNPTAPLSDQQSWQAQDSMSMNQMLQYHYHQQQQLLQQQYQQQLHMQNAYFQTQQQYMNQQPYQQYQQHYVQQQQHQSSTYQQATSFDQSQQHQQQSQQGQTQYHQSQDLAYQAYQMAYQQQYQQYQVYQHPSQKQHDELVQQVHSQQHMGQNLKSSKTGTPDYDGAAKSSESPHLRVQSPQILQ
ncbi:hypothetical protein ACS0TY_017967 [Phlomoides rotata]